MATIVIGMPNSSYSDMLRVYSCRQVDDKVKRCRSKQLAGFRTALTYLQKAAWKRFLCVVMQVGTYEESKKPNIRCTPCSCQI